jgi:hypothetical protein
VDVLELLALRIFNYTIELDLQVINSFFHALIFLAQMGTTSFYKVWHKRYSVQLEIALNKIKDPFTENRCVSGVFK